LRNITIGFVIAIGVLAAVSLSPRSPDAREPSRTEPVYPAGETARSGEEVYQSKCFACHGTGAAGAPKTAAEWAALLPKGIEVLYASTISGTKGMPPRGLCMDCSEAELKAAVDFAIKDVK